MRRDGGRMLKGPDREERAESRRPDKGSGRKGGARDGGRMRAEGAAAGGRMLKGPDSEVRAELRRPGRGGGGWVRGAARRGVSAEGRGRTHGGGRGPAAGRGGAWGRNAGKAARRARARGGGLARGGARARGGEGGSADLCRERGQRKPRLRRRPPQSIITFSRRSGRTPGAVGPLYNALHPVIPKSPGPPFSLTGLMEILGGSLGGVQMTTLGGPRKFPSTLHRLHLD